MVRILARCPRIRVLAVDGHSAAGAVKSPPYRGNGSVAHRGGEARQPAANGDCVAGTVAAAANAR